MPFDGFEKKFETKPDVFSLEGLIAWLETQPGETEYDFCEGDTCLMTNYFAAHGIAMDPGTASSYGGVAMYWTKDGKDHPFVDVARGSGDYETALTRARALASRQEGR